jgi:hypothetical protein
MPRRKMKMNKKINAMKRERRRVLSGVRENENCARSASTIGTKGLVKRLNKKTAIIKVKAAGKRMTSPVMNDFFIFTAPWVG